MDKFTVILDNGHGINTAGKRSPLWPDGKQLFEYEFNRDIVNRLKEMLERAQIGVEVIVPELIDISLSERCKRANKIYAKNKNCIFISIHANAGGGTGWEAYTTVGITKSDKLAEYLYKEAIANGFKIRQDITDGDMDKEKDFYVIKNTKMPAVLTENFFMDTKSDCDYIMSFGGRQKIALMHFNAIVKYAKDMKLLDLSPIASNETPYKCNLV